MCIRDRAGPGAPPQSRAPQTFERLRGVLGENYQVRDIKPGEGIASDIDVLLLAGPENLDDRALREIDQFLMSGGAVIALAGQFRINQQRQDLSVAPVKTGLAEMFEHHGVKIEPRLVADKESIVFPMPVGRRRILKNPYVLFPLILGDQLSQGGAVMAQIGALVMYWSSPIELLTDKTDGLSVDVLARTSGESWTLTGANSTPNFELQPETGFPPPSSEEKQTKGFPVAVSLVGSFSSYYSKKNAPEENPNFDAGKDRLLPSSPDDARLVVIASSEFASDVGFLVSQQTAREGFNNLTLVHNLVDWALQDADLLEIRSRGAQNRILRVDEDQATQWQIINIILAAIALALIFGVNAARRRAQLPLVTSATGSKGESDE